MKTKNIIRLSWALVLLMLFAWMPMKGMAQIKIYELVVEKTDGTQQTFKITGNHPWIFGEYQDGVKTLVIAGANDETGYIPCSEVKRLFTRFWKEVNIVDVVNSIKSSTSGNTPSKETDYNDDGIVNIADIMMVIKYIIDN